MARERQGFPRGEAVEQRETDEECGWKCCDFHVVTVLLAGRNCTPPLIRHGLRRATFPPGEGFICRNTRRFRRIEYPRQGGGMTMVQEGQEHSLQLKQRRKLTMTGVTEVVSFEDTAVVLQTSMGDLVVQGHDLQLKTLSVEGGQVVVEGSISALVYEEPRQSGWRRLFR